MYKAKSRYTSRIAVIKYCALIIICLYGMYLFVIQVARGYLYAERAQDSQQRVETIIARRGAILDANGRVMADNEYTYSLSITPQSLTPEELEALLERISIFAATPLSTLRQRIAAARRQDTPRVEIATSLTLQQISYIIEHSHLFPHVQWGAHTFRSYPFHEELAQVTGYVREISAEELRVRHNQGYQPHDLIGKTGLERQYDQLLKGQRGAKIVGVDAFGTELNVRNTTDPIPGYDLVTSIDTRIQKLAWEALGRRIGSAIVMRPHNGEILAMVSYPSYNPNHFYSSNAQEALNSVLNNEHSPLINRAIQTAYPPASTFKVLMATVIANEDIYGIRNTVLCRGYYELGNLTLREWGEGRNFGYLDLFGGLSNSSNVYFWTLGVEHVGIERIVNYSHRFGFGSKTNIDLPNEVSGLVPNPEWKQFNFNQRWTAGDTANVSVGQGFLNATPLQVANMAAAISNNGVVYKPHILTEVRNSETGEVIERHSPEVLHDLQFDTATFETVRQAMRGVIEDGTAHPVITTPVVKVAGKTGTSEVQKGSDRFHSWFVSYAPIDAPPESQVVVVVFVDAANEWEWWAPKAANIILHGIFANTDYQRTVYELRNSPRGLWYL